MAGTVFHNIKVAALAGAVPKQTVRTESFQNIFGTDIVNRVRELTGIEQLHKTERNQTASDLGYVAAKKILDQNMIDKSEIGALIFVSTSPDYMWPSSANVLQYRLGLNNDIISYDVTLGCSGYINGIHLCSSLLQSMKQRYALLIVGQADKIPNILEREKPDDSLLMMFGDACTATLLERVESASEICTELFTDGSGFKMLVRGGMCRSYYDCKKPVRCSDGYDRSIEDPYMDGMGVFAFSTREAPKAIKEFIDKKETSLDEYSYVFLHQANKMIIDRIAKKLKLPSEKVPISLNEYGNTAGASIPLTIIKTYSDNDSEVQENILLCAFGVGLSWGVVSMSLSPNVVLPLVETDDYFAEGELHYERM